MTFSFFGCMHMNNCTDQIEIFSFLTVKLRLFLQLKFTIFCFTLKVRRRIGGIHSEMPHAPATTFIFGGAPACRAHVGLVCIARTAPPFSVLNTDSIQIHCGVQADRESHVEDRLEVLAKIRLRFLLALLRSGSKRPSVCLYTAVHRPGRASSLNGNTYYIFFIVSCIRFFPGSTDITFTSTMSPTLTTSRGCLIYRSAIWEICTSPS